MNPRLALLTLALAAPLAGAQTTFDGDAAGAGLGAVFDVAEDLNGDGVFELVAGMPTFGAAGRVVVLSGADGSLVREHLGASPGDAFGGQVAFLGDFNSDGVGDYAVAAAGHASSTGNVTVFSGATGAVLHVFTGQSAGDRFGASIEGAGDVNGDNRRDLIVGAPGYDAPGESNNGRVYVYSGVSGFLVHELGPQAAANVGIEFGTFVSSVGDVDGDGRDEVFASTPEPDTQFLSIGHVAMFSGATGATLLSWTGLDGGHGDFDFWGSGIDGAGDVDGDGTPDFLIGVDKESAGHDVRLVSGATFQPLWVQSFDTPFGHVGNPTGLGDVNGDGVPDQAFLLPLTDTLRVVSGAHGATLDEIPNPAPASPLGRVVRAVDDVNGDGRRDVLIGLPGFDGPAGVDAGQIRVVSVAACPTPQPYCFPALNSTGQRARIGWAGTPGLQANDLVLTASDGPPGTLGLFFYGGSGTYTAFGDGFRCVDAGGVGLFRLGPPQPISAQGTVQRALDLTAAPAASGPGQIEAGVTRYFQFWFRDPTGPGGTGFNLSDGLRVAFCP